jgi:predicted transcriptional regulator
MTRLKLDQLSRRERQIMDLLFQRGEATVNEVRDGMTDPPGYSAVRAQLNILEQKGWLDHRQDGPRYVYVPRISPAELQGSALGRVLSAFFGGSRANLMAALYDDTHGDISREELDSLGELVERLRKERS